MVILLAPFLTYSPLAYSMSFSNYIVASKIWNSQNTPIRYIPNKNGKVNLRECWFVENAEDNNILLELKDSYGQSLCRCIFEHCEIFCPIVFWGWFGSSIFIFWWGRRCKGGPLKDLFPFVDVLPLNREALGAYYCEWISCSHQFSTITLLLMTIHVIAKQDYSWLYSLCIVRWDLTLKGF